MKEWEANLRAQVKLHVLTAHTTRHIKTGIQYNRQPQPTPPSRCPRRDRALGARSSSHLVISSYPSVPALGSDERARLPVPHFCGAARRRCFTAEPCSRGRDLAQNLEAAEAAVRAPLLNTPHSRQY
jgi:hypothetical protein